MRFTYNFHLAEKQRCEKYLFKQSLYFNRVINSVNKFCIPLPVWFVNLQVSNIYIYIYTYGKGNVACA